MKTTIILFSILILACYLYDKTGQSIYVGIQPFVILITGAFLVKKLKLI